MINNALKPIKSRFWKPKLRHQQWNCIYFSPVMFIAITFIMHSEETNWTRAVTNHCDLGAHFNTFFISIKHFVLKTAKRWKYWHGCRRSMSAWLESIICIMGLIINTEWHTIEFLELKPNKDLFKTVGFWILYSWWLLTRQVLAWLLNQKLTVHTQVKFRTVHESFCVFNDFTGDFRS